jgi:hypothetical protein
MRGAILMRARSVSTLAVPATAVALALLAPLATGSLMAQVPSISVEKATCFRVGDNQVVHATTRGEPGGSTARLYFQWADHPYYYWVDFEHDVAAGPSLYWVTPPKPESRNHEVEYYGVLLSDTGRELARSAVQKSPVTSDCKLKLTLQQLGAAQNLTIGETSTKQAKNRVNGFLCDGINTRVNPENVKRPDETCRTCIVAWWQRKELLFLAEGAAGVGAITSIVLDRPEPSSSRPTGQ